MAWVVGLGGPIARESDLTGKAVSLHSRVRRGLPVQPGFCVSVQAYRHAIEASGLGAQIDAYLAAGLDDHQTSDRLRGLFGSTTMPVAVAAEIRTAYTALGQDVPVALRSNAAEDTAAAPFAGRQDGFLWVRGADAVVSGVIDCWASLFTPQAIGYCRRFEVPATEVAVGVVVQQTAARVGEVVTGDEHGSLRGENTSFRIAACFTAGGRPVDGVIVSEGDRFGGWSLWVDAGHLVYSCILGGPELTTIRSGTAIVMPGTHSIIAEFDCDSGGFGRAGRLSMRLDGTEVVRARIARTTPFTPSGNGKLNIGIDRGTPITSEYRRGGGNPFTGVIYTVEVERGAGGVKTTAADQLCAERR
ncbi:hypothetical protein OK015_02135 [Mycobacterium sp. Aquia_216]|uniref:PEP/pyruvate-binding domain-containing protein n=1 Tax=Mycobacterium sp. Aquia_216 TaxID=2991729 RepID=UPI00227A584C|nr:PEP/pyruvate-binding domain-containing protein [Mycobacterium sp. Aquia_216]WAJ45352.1 hypothetical protein OK015_02135 [Mycobacterium sp. Aquia_216]